MQCTPLDQLEQLDAIAAGAQPAVILKHNTTCPISKGVLKQIEAANVQLPGVSAIHVLDLLVHRDISDEIASRFSVEHQSPQLLVIQNGQCTYSEWGYDISAEATKEAMEA